MTPPNFVPKLIKKSYGFVIIVVKHSTQMKIAANTKTIMVIMLNKRNDCFVFCVESLRLFHNTVVLKIKYVVQASAVSKSSVVIVIVKKAHNKITPLSISLRNSQDQRRVHSHSVPVFEMMHFQCSL